MPTYKITVKNINAKVAKMLLPRGESTTFSRDARSETELVRNVVKELFDGCTLMGEDIQNSSGRYGQISAPGNGGRNLYGRIYVECDLQ